MNPTAVILDPVLAEAGDLCRATLERAMIQQMLSTHAEQLKILVSELKEPVAPVGSALQALDAILEQAATPVSS
jgi:hypothetical protein